MPKGLGNNFLYMTPKAQTVKEKIDKMDFIKIKNFYASKDVPSKKEKRQSAEWNENICVIYRIRIKYLDYVETL